MDFHQRAATIELDQFTVGADVQRGADPLLGQRIQGFGDFGVFSEPNNCSNTVDAVHDSAGKAGTPRLAVVDGGVVLQRLSI